MVKVPTNLQEVDKTTLTWDQLRAALAKLDLRDRILLQLDMTNALRPSELFAFRWKCHRIASVSLTIVETIYKGKIRPYGKTKGSLAEVPIASELSDDLLTWRQVSEQLYDKKRKRNGPPPSDPEAFIFPNREGAFMDPSNYRKRILHKLAEELELPKLTFQVIRRTIATLGKTKGHVKDIQGIMRHTKASTTTDVYIQSLEPEVRTAINSIYDELVGNGTNGSGAKASSKPSTSSRSESGELAGTAKSGRSRRASSAIAKRAETTGAKPVRGVVLEFATRMQQSLGKGVLLND